jgi:hypothetical protein
MDDNQYEQFFKIMNEFLKDFLIPFPEYILIINKWWNFEELVKDKIDVVYNHIKKTLSQHFIDVLNQNVDIFSEENTIRTDFLPQIEFKHLWNNELSDKSKEMIWKYLQLILITIINCNFNYEKDNDIESILQNMDTAEIQEKLSSTIQNMEKLFKENKKEDLTDFHSQIENMLNGNLGNIAKEMANDTFKDIEIDTNDPMKLFQNIFSDSNNISNLVKNIGEKLDSKLKSGEFDEKDLMNESLNLFSQMKNMPGLDNFANILNNISNVPNINKKNLDVKKMEERFKQEQTKEKTKERIRKKAENKKDKKSKVVNDEPLNNIMNDDEIIKLFNQK